MCVHVVPVGSLPLEMDFSVILDILFVQAFSEPFRIVLHHIITDILSHGFSLFLLGLAHFLQLPAGRAYRDHIELRIAPA